VPGYTKNRDGIIIPDQTTVQLLRGYRQDPLFVAGGGYYKLSKYLSIEHGIYINHKKIYRLCKEEKILLFTANKDPKRTVKKQRCEYKNITAPNQLWQFDIKYGYIHGENRWFFILAFIDVFSKKVPGYYIGLSCKAGDLITTLNEALRAEGITAEHHLNIRSDNGPQMSSNKFYFYLKRLEQKLSHEFIPPRSPNRNAYVEAFNSILETELLSTRYFHTFKDAYEAVVKFVNDYNNRRIHGSINYLSPKMFLEKFKLGEFSDMKISV
jgi:putative transposase